MSLRQISRIYLTHFQLRRKGCQNRQNQTLYRWLNCAAVRKRTDSRPTFTVSVLVAQYRALLDGAVRTKQLSDVIFLLLFVQHPDKQLPVVCKQFHNKRVNINRS